jgi:vacuolar-type H+-ATPase subunit H
MIEHSKKVIGEVEDKSLLPLIGEKEKELEAMLEKTKAECEEKVRVASAEAEAHIKGVKDGLPGLAQKKFDAGVKQIEQEIQNISQTSRKETESLPKKAEKHIEDAKKAAIKLILPEIDKC